MVVDSCVADVSGKKKYDWDPRYPDDSLSLSTFVHKWNLESNQWVAATRENKFFFSRENWGKERDGLWQMCGCVNP